MKHTVPDTHRDVVAEGTRMAESLGHTLTCFRPWRWRRGMWVAKCRACFAGIAVTPTPRHDEATICGEAVSMPCSGEGGKEMRKARLHAMRHPEPPDDQ